MIGLGAEVVKQSSHLTHELLATPASFLTLGSYTLKQREGNSEPVLSKPHRVQCRWTEESRH